MSGHDNNGRLPGVSMDHRADRLRNERKEPPPMTNPDQLSGDSPLPPPLRSPQDQTGSLGSPSAPQAVCEGRHTPGPWVELETDSSVDAVGVTGWQDIGTPDGRVVAISVGYRSFVLTDYVQEANARLIAAAPDLLEALKAALAYGRGEFAWDLEGEADEMLAKADAAIAKATGGAGD